MAKHRCGKRSPVDAAVVVKPFVLGRNHGAGEGRGDVGKPDPVQAPPRRVHADLVDHAAVPVQKQGVGEPVRAPHLLKGRQLRPREIKPGDERDGKRSATRQQGRDDEFPSS